MHEWWTLGIWKTCSLSNSGYEFWLRSSCHHHHTSELTSPRNTNISSSFQRNILPRILLITTLLKRSPEPQLSNPRSHKAQNHMTLQKVWQTSRLKSMHPINIRWSSLTTLSHSRAWPDSFVSEAKISTNTAPRGFVMRLKKRSADDP